MFLPLSQHMQLHTDKKANWQQQSLIPVCFTYNNLFTLNIIETRAFIICTQIVRAYHPITTHVSRYNCSQFSTWRLSNINQITCGENETKNIQGHCHEFQEHSRVLESQSQLEEHSRICANPGIKPNMQYPTSKTQ